VVGTAAFPYGEPVTSPSLTTRRPSPIVRVFGPLVSPRTWAATINVVFDLFSSIVVFVAFVVALALFIGTFGTVVLIPVFLVVLLTVTRVIGKLERARLRAVLDVDIPDPYPAFTGTIWRRFLARVTSAQPWKEGAYALVTLPLAVVSFVVTLATWSGSLALVLMPLYLANLPGATAHFGLFAITAGQGEWIAVAVGAVGLLMAPWVSRGCAALRVFVARNLVGRGVTAELEERVDLLEATRSWALEVAESERRRIERDLHDGAQQRLVALAMDLGMAREKFDADPDGARALIDDAHAEAKRAIVELRDLARGIHPAALGDQGLEGAIPVLADRCPVPVEVEVSVPSRPSPSIEGMVYFIVSESLANVAKHSEATRAGVRVVEQAGWLVVEIGDDGRGGAWMAAGSGLQGLADRVASVDGRFEVSSPWGGPTVIRAELPCAS
jgi:signal transduction histidine kinase